MSTTTNQSIQTQGSSISTAIKAGAVAGLGGGLVFGLMMGMMGMLPMVGMLAGQESAVVGFIIHMIISAFIGATFGVIATRLPAGWATVIIGGGVYGIVWWVLGALILMPVMLGMTQMVFVIGGPQWMSLLGHVIYGVVTGVLFVPLKQRF
jgi:uncharacterized membrane protein YagU involved in acid resistance